MVFDMAYHKLPWKYIDIQGTCLFLKSIYTTNLHQLYSPSIATGSL